jgi:hypothetical protein
VTDVMAGEFYNLDNRIMVRILSGSLKIKVADFSPNENIEFGVISRTSFSIYATDSKGCKESVLRVMSQGLDSQVLNSNTLTKEDLKIIRNKIYAQKGYVFKDETLKAYFNQFAWYMPDPNLKIEDITLTKEEAELVAQLLKREEDY